MKKLICGAMTVFSASLLFAIGSKDASGNAAAQTIAVAKNMTHDEIVAKAKEEAAAAKSSGTIFKVYGTSSRIADAGKSFTQLYGIDVETTNVKDSEIYTKLQAEITGNVDGADVVLTQNGAVMKVQMIDTGYLLNYTPPTVVSDIDISDREPLVHQYINKLFIYNTLGSNVPAITNVWQLTEPQMKGRVFFKSPETEKVNENFLIMLTNKTWADKLAAAYKNLYGRDINLGEYKNAGYKWIAEFLANCSFADSDTKMAEQISHQQASGRIGLFVLSKLRSKTVRTENLQVASYYANSKNADVEPFAGFMYPLYAMIVKTTTMPYTSMLFVEHLVTPTGFAPWSKDIGAYSSNNSISVNSEDRPLAYWRSRLVMEEPEYINQAYADVFEFISKQLAK
ncbi:MAG: ABC transporter substrate-binding protein [Treponema sp.]|nr:ABC transporter substrate-binding protein [Treponema sp.]